MYPDFFRKFSILALLGTLLWTVPVASFGQHLPQVTRFERQGDVVYAFSPQGKRFATTIDPALQDHLQNFVKTRGDNPIAALVVVDVQTGDIVAAVEGQKAVQPQTSSLFYGSFPAASLFKTVLSAAAFELLDWQAHDEEALRGGCGKVRANGVWLRDDRLARNNPMSLKEAYARSCNSFFAKLAVKKLGLGAVLNYAKKFAWNRDVPADFVVPAGKIHLPSAQSISVQTVGQLGSGLGKVYTNVFHVAWQYAMLANGGKARPLRLFKATQTASEHKQLLAPNTLKDMQMIMPAVVGRKGTAYETFHSRRYRKLKTLVGGKTGTLSGSKPKGINTWFAGLYPIEEPRYAAAAVVVINDLWHIRGPDLVAEAFWALQFPEKLRQIAQKNR